MHYTTLDMLTTPTPLIYRVGTFDYGIIQTAFITNEYRLKKAREYKPKSVVIDIGAHIGAFSALAASFGFTVYGYEAHPENAALYTYNTVLIERMYGTDVYPHWGAVGCSGVVVLPKDFPTQWGMANTGGTSPIPENTAPEDTSFKDTLFKNTPLKDISLKDTSVEYVYRIPGCDAATLWNYPPIALSSYRQHPLAVDVERIVSSVPHLIPLLRRLPFPPIGTLPHDHTKKQGEYRPFNPSDVACIKMDIEGHEYTVLRDIRSWVSDDVYITGEYHLTPAYSTHTDAHTFITSLYPAATFTYHPNHSLGLFFINSR